MSLAGRQYFIYAIEQVDFSEIDWVFFSAGGAVSSQYVPKVLAQGCRVIDNSSYFRMHPDVPLVAFSVNHEMCQSAPLIANPNCSTIQLAVALNPLLHLEPSQVIITSMQSISGAGRGAMANLKEDTRCMLQSGAMQGMAFDLDTKIDVWADAGYCKEEWKIRHELPKILGIDVLIGVTTVRVPVLFAHSQSVTVTLKRSVSLSELISLFEDSPLIRVYAHEDIFSPMKVSYGNANVHVGRIRPVGTDGLVWNFMVISDNILRGGATNAFEILRSLVSVNE
jgi:aspartate-semialdehyde dehydrogenase